MKHYIEHSKEAYSDKIFISHKNQEITFSDFYYNVCSKSRALKNLNLSKQSSVGIFLSNPIDIIEIYFSCLQLNKIPIIFPSNINIFELSEIIKSYKIDFVITEWLRKKQIQSIKKVSFFYIQELSSSHGGCAPIDFDTNIKDINKTQSMHLTSGSTGLPKLIHLTFSNFINSVYQWDEQLKFSDSEQYIQCLPLNHIAGLSIIIRAQIKGFKSILMNKFNAAQINFEIDNGATLISLIPSMFKRLLDDRLGRSFPPHFKGIIIGGDGCSNSLMKQALKSNVPIYKSYGMTETCSGVSGFWVHQFPDMLDSVGRPFKKTQITISDSKVLIKGPTVSPYNQDGKDNNNTILTNDIGFLKKRFLFIEGRCDDIVISGGENVSLSNIKNLLFQHNNIIDVHLNAEKDDRYGTLITAFVEVSENLKSQDIYNYLIEHLSENQCPKDIQIVDQIHHD